MSAAARRTRKALAVEVDALHAQLCAVVALMVADRQARGLPIPFALGGPETPDTASGVSPCQRHLSLVVSR